MNLIDLAHTFAQFDARLEEARATPLAERSAADTSTLRYLEAQVGYSRTALLACALREDFVGAWATDLEKVAARCRAQVFIGKTLTAEDQFALEDTARALSRG